MFCARMESLTDLTRVTFANRWVNLTSSGINHLCSEMGNPLQGWKWFPHSGAVAFSFLFDTFTRVTTVRNVLHLHTWGFGIESQQSCQTKCVFFFFFSTGEILHWWRLMLPSQQATSYLVRETYSLWKWGQKNMCTVTKWYDMKKN